MSGRSTFGEIGEEDYKTGLGIQAALASGANTEFLFGRNEPGNQNSTPGSTGCSRNRRRRR